MELIRTTMSPISKSTIESLVSEIRALSDTLPNSIALGSPDDKIWTVLNGSEGETVWETLNRRFDTLFGEHCRDENGRLHYVRRGQYGMHAVCTYLSSIDFDAGGIPLDLVEMKLRRLHDEL